MKTTEAVMETPDSKKTEVCGLCRYNLKDEALVRSDLVRKEITRAFAEQRAFAFQPDAAIIAELKNGATIEQFTDRFIEMKNRVFESIAEGDSSQLDRMMSDTRLSQRIANVMHYLHLALAGGNYTTLPSRRFVVIKELPGKSTLYHISDETTVISHVGQGPHWQEIPTIYLGLKTFDAIDRSMKRNSTELLEAFRLLLSVEERAIETGFVHSEVYPAEFSLALNLLVDACIAYTRQTEVEIKPEAEKVEKEEKAFSDKQREQYLRQLDARTEHDMMNFDYEKNLKGIEGLERLARRYKKDGDRDSLFQVTRLLVSAAGHDIHEVRNRANIILERIFAPKEYDAPLATVFYNLMVGDSHHFEFNLPEEKKGYFVRIYRNSTAEELFVESEMSYEDHELVYLEDKHVYTANVSFKEYGHCDFVVFARKVKNSEWVSQHGTSGRINVLPDLRGELVLEIFVDIHGHSRLYWRDETGHPGLVYNENGEVIRLGRFSDVAKHIPDIKARYNVTSIYLLGCQTRGTHREDWAAGATSPSPFSPISLVDIEPSLGGEKEFKELITAAHAHDIKIIVDCIPHVNRHSNELPDEDVVFCYGGDGQLYPRASTDGRYGSWDDGKLLNYRRFEVWLWVWRSVKTLVEKFDIDGIRFDSAHAVPIVMKKNNFPYIYEHKRSHEEMVEGRIIVNDRWDEHFVTTGYYDSQCRDLIAIPFHQFMMLNIERLMRAKGKKFFINIAECFWGHERFLSRSGIIPYNASLFKICENILHGKSDVREVYHIYDNYYPTVLPQGTQLLGILGNHDERRALNTFGHRGLRASVALTSFMSDIIMDFEGSAEGEGWKVYLDNIYVNWNQFEYASHRSVSHFYTELYEFHRRVKGTGYLVWANNNMVAAAIKCTDKEIWLGAFNFADSNQTASVQFDNPRLPIADDAYYKVVDPVYSPITGHFSYYSGKELKVSRINTIVSFTERYKLLRLEKVENITEVYDEFLKDSFFRLCSISHSGSFSSNFSFCEVSARADSYERLESYLCEHLLPLFWNEFRYFLEIGLKRIFYHMFTAGLIEGGKMMGYIERMEKSSDEKVAVLGKALKQHNSKGAFVFMSAEADPFSKSGGLANVVYELPRELVKHGEEVCVITGYYRHGDSKAMDKMRAACDKYRCTYTGKNVRFKIHDRDYEVGVHFADVEGIKYYLLDHFELFDGLYWGVTSEEKLIRRIGFARACAEVICTFGLRPYFTFTNDAYAGLFNGVVRSDHVYASNPNFEKTTFLHIIHNGGWQYFDAYARHEKGFDLFSLFNLPGWKAADFSDPVHGDRINCMAAGIRFADRNVTVSPSYARQIEYQCDGLEHILNNVIGISNAVGKDLFVRMKRKFDDSRFVDRNYPALKARIKQDDVLAEKVETRFPEILKGLEAVQGIADQSRAAMVNRVMNKMMLQCERNLKVDPDIVMFCMIHRITEQKGFQLLLDCSEGLFRHLGYQAIIGGAVSSGDKRGEEMAHGLWMLSQYYPGQADVSIGFQDVSIPLMAGDVFCMPSMSEPGGISQLEALLCGSLVVARATGGLRDTVFPIRQSGDEHKGNGFLFSDFSAWAFYDAMERAHKFLRENDDATVQKARENARNSVYFWDKPAREYIRRVYDIKEIVRIIE